MIMPEDITETLVKVIQDSDLAYSSPNIPPGMEAYVRKCLLPQLALQGLSVTRLEPVVAANNESSTESPTTPDFVTWVHIAFDRNSRPRLLIEVQ